MNIIRRGYPNVWNKINKINKINPGNQHYYNFYKKCSNGKKIIYYHSRPKILSANSLNLDKQTNIFTPIILGSVDISVYLGSTLFYIIF